MNTLTAIVDCLRCLVSFLVCVSTYSAVQASLTWIALSNMHFPHSLGHLALSHSYLQHRLNPGVEKLPCSPKLVSCPILSPPPQPIYPHPILRKLPPSDWVLISSTSHSQQEYNDSINPIPNPRATPAF